MQKFDQIKKKSTLLLITGILILSASFLIISCGSDSPFKVDNPFGGAYALDNTVCPVAGTCTTAFSSQAFKTSRDIGGEEITMEAWIKPKVNSSKSVFLRQLARGVGLSVVYTAATTSTPAEFKPRFSIKRVIPSATGPGGTSTVEYTVTGTVDLVLDTWAHIAGILVNDDHTDVAGDGVTHADCAGAEDNKPHLDMYVNGSFAGCAASTGGTSAHGDADAGDFLGYAHNPAGLNMTTPDFQGIIDEFRLWTVSRLEGGLLQTCKDRELGFNSGDCGRDTDSLIAYLRFNEGTGYTVNDYSGLGSGAGEYPDPDNAGEFLHWSTGWTTDTPGLTTAD